MRIRFGGGLLPLAEGVIMEYWTLQQWSGRSGSHLEGGWGAERERERELIASSAGNRAAAGLFSLAIYGPRRRKGFSRASRAPAVILARGRACGGACSGIQGISRVFGAGAARRDVLAPARNIAVVHFCAAVYDRWESRGTWVYSRIEFVLR